MDKKNQPLNNTQEMAHEGEQKILIPKYILFSCLNSTNMSGQQLGKGRVMQYIMMCSNKH